MTSINDTATWMTDGFFACARERQAVGNPTDRYRNAVWDMFSDLLQNKDQEIATYLGARGGGQAAAAQYGAATYDTLSSGPGGFDEPGLIEITTQFAEVPTPEYDV